LPATRAPLTPRASVHHRIAAWSGWVFVISFPLGWGLMAGFLTPPVAPTATTDELVAFVSDGGVLQKLGLMFALAGAGSLLPMAGVLGDQLQRMEGGRPIWAQVQLVCAGLTVWLLSSACIFFAVAVFRAERHPDLIQLMHDLGWLTFIAPVSVIVVWMSAVGTAILGDQHAPPVMPRWVGYLSLWAALLSAPGFAAILFHTGPFAWNGMLVLWIPLLIFLVWWIVLNLQLLRVFTLFFATFLYYRALAPEQFAASSGNLSQDIGLLNTLILLASSWCVASAMQHLDAGGAPQQILRLLLAALVCGGVFAGLKVFEYQRVASTGVNVLTDNFYMFYFMFTGIHLVHLLAGMALLGGTTMHLRRVLATGSESNRELIGFASCFWHMVDMIWIVLFPLLYLLQ